MSVGGICRVCNSPASSRAKTGLCRQCYDAGRYVPKTRNCRDCGAQITKQGKHCLCRTCAATLTSNDPAVIARRAEAMRTNWQDPGFRQEKSAAISRAKRRCLANPEMLEKYQAMGRRLNAEGKWRAVLTPGCEARKRASLKARETRLGWCPPEYRARYLFLMRSLKGKARAKRAVLEEIARDAARAHKEAVRHLSITQASEAADFLRKYTAVRRLDNGLWRYGTADLTPEQLIERAQLRGWKPERLAA